MKVNASLLRSSNLAIGAALDLDNLTNERNEMPWQLMEPGLDALLSLRLTF